MSDCMFCKTHLDDHKDDNALCGQCGKAYYQGKIDMVIESRSMVINPNMNREKICERLLREENRCRTVQINFGRKEK